MGSEKPFCDRCGKTLKPGQTVFLLEKGLCHPECKDLETPCDVCGEPHIGSFEGIAGHLFHYCDRTCEAHLRVADDCAGAGKITKIKEARRTAFGD